MPENDTSQLIQLRQQIEIQFNEEELRALCFELGVDYENLGGRGKAANVLELVQWAKRKNRLADLMALVKAARPNVPDIVALLPPHHIPYRRNELFTGREEWLTELHDALHRDETVAVTQAVAGLGGVGKTQLALAYCYRHLDDYDLIQWLRADDVTTLGTALAELAYRLGLARRELTDQPTLHQLAFNWLHTTDKRWLLVYDNADAIQTNELGQFLPKLGHGACLITSRNPNWGGLAQTLNLTHFSDGEAVAFLLGQSEMSDEEITAHPQGKDAQKLAHMLGNLPLALEHARAYVEETGCSLADYTDYFENERAELWADTLPPANYDEKTITTTWELAFAQARQTPGAAVLLNICCFLAPDEIPLTLITETVKTWCKTPPEGVAIPEELLALAESKMQLDKSIATLHRYSLLLRDGDKVFVHRLVQTVARDQMLLREIQNWFVVITALLEDYALFCYREAVTRERKVTMLSHVLETLRLALSQYHDEVISFMQERSIVEGKRNNLSIMLNIIQFDLVFPTIEHHIAVCEKGLISNDPDIEIYLNKLGKILEACSCQFEAFRPYLERALVISEKAFGSEHPGLTIHLNNLGKFLQEERDYGAALPYFKRAAAISEKALGQNHTDTNDIRNNLAALLAEMEGKS